MNKRAKTAIIAGVVGMGLIILFSTYTLFNPKPPGMTIIVDNHSYKAGYGSYNGRLPDGTFYGADVASSYTMPKETIQVSEGSEIKFSSESWKRAELRQSWIVGQNAINQFFLERVDYTTFRLPSDIPPGDYILTVYVVYDDSLVSIAYYHHKLQVS